MYEKKLLERPIIVKEYFKAIPIGSSQGVPKQSMLIKFARELSVDERELLMNGLRSHFTTDDTTLIDVPGLIEQTNSTIFYINIFSLAVGAISIILSFFLVLVSFTANVRENSWEFGVLRAIGLDKKQITRCYMYEALSLIISSGLLGSLVGMVIAVTLTLQFLMFLELPFTFIFPYTMFFFCFGMGIIVSVFGSYFSLVEFRDKSIANIVKGLI